MDENQEGHQYEEDEYLAADDVDQIVDDNGEDAPMDDDDDDLIAQLDDSVGTYDRHQDIVYCVALDPVLLDGSIAVTGGGDDNARIWRTDTGEELAVLSGHTDTVTEVKFSKKGQLLVTAGMDGKILVWAPQGPVATPGAISADDRAAAWSSPRLVASLEGPDEIVAIDWHQNLIAAGANDGTVWVWALPRGAVQHVLTYHSSAVTSVKFSVNGLLFTGEEAGTLVAWDLTTGTQYLKFSADDARFQMEGGITSIEPHPNGNLVAVGGHDGQIKFINVANALLMAAPELRHDLNPESASFSEYGCAVEAIAFAELSPGNVVFVSADTQGGIYEWEAASLKRRISMKHHDAVSSLVFIPGTPFFVTSSIDKTVKIWDARTGQDVRTLVGHREVVHMAAVSANGARLVSVGDDGVAKVFLLA